MAGIDKRVLKTIIAEAGGDPKAMQAVAAVIFNRAQATGKTPLEVVKQPGQFEGYSNPGSSIVHQLGDPKLLARAEAAYTGISNGTVPDPTNGGLSFRSAGHTGGMPSPNGTVNIGGNVFALGNAPATASAAIDQAAPEAPKPFPAMAYAPAGLPMPPSVPLPRLRPNPHAGLTAVSVNPDGSPVGGVPRSGPYYPHGGAGAMERALHGVDPAAQHSAPSFDWQTLPPPPMATLDVPQAPRPPSPALTSHSVHTVAIGPDGNPVTTPSAPDLQTALNALAAQRRMTAEGVTKTTGGQAGTVQMPAGVTPSIVPKLYQQMPTPPARQSFPTPAQLAAINDVSGVPTSHTAIPTQEQLTGTPSPQLAFAGDQNTGIPATQAIDTIAPTQPTGPAFNPGTWGSAPMFPRPPVSPPASIPLTSMGTVDPMTQLLPQAEAGFNTTGPGHIIQYLKGEPVQGGLLRLLPHLAFGQPHAPAYANSDALLAALGEKYKHGLLGDGQGAAILRGRGSYTVAKPSNGVLGENALMPTTAMNGKIRNGYGD